MFCTEPEKSKSDETLVLEAVEPKMKKLSFTVPFVVDKNLKNVDILAFLDDKPIELIDVSCTVDESSLTSTVNCMLEAVVMPESDNQAPPNLLVNVLDEQKNQHHVHHVHFEQGWTFCIFLHLRELSE